MPKVSIIIPIWGTAYNEFLPACLESVKKQTFKDYEIIVVDTETDLPTARNVGIKKAKGEWILCLDADDMIDPTFLEKTIGKDDIVSVGQQMFGNENDLWIEIQLIQYRNIFQRVWIALKYIFGYQCRYGHWDCFLLKPEDCSRLKELLNKVIENENKKISEKV